MKTVKHSRLLLALFASFALFFVACEQNDTAGDRLEDAGEATGDAVEDAGDAVEDAVN